MKAVRDTSSILTGGEVPKQTEALMAMLTSDHQLTDTPTAISEAIITGALDPSSTPALRALAYQVSDYIGRQWWLGIYANLPPCP